MVLGLTVVGTLVLGIALRQRLSGDMTEPMSALAHLGNPVVGGASDPVAAGTGRNLARVGGAERTAFNRAAHAIRPSVLSIRASFGQKDAAGRELERTGSAVVVDPRGYAVTCQHVVAGATRVSARRFREPDRWLPARLVAIEGDLALFELKDDAAFVPATLADSERVQVGDWVLAVGHPFGLELTVTAGIVGRRRATLQLPDGRTYDGLLQTDAPINEGSSGGPLVDAAGQVIGLNTAIYAPTGVFSGAGFAIPANRIRQFVERALRADLEPAAQPSAGWGIGLVDLTPAVAAQLSYPTSSGVMINRVLPGSPAADAALASGDIVTAIAGEAVLDLDSVKVIRDRLPRTDMVPIRVWRRGTTFTVVLQARRSTG
jgi:serine protease Do